MTPEEARRVEQLAAKLAEDWECVQILVSRADSDSTHRYFYGLGNWYGRQGMARDFIKCDEARTNADEISKAINPEDE